MTQTPDNGGPAFPMQTTVQVEDCDGNNHAAMAQCFGMSLRDWFATHATEDDIRFHMRWHRHGESDVKVSSCGREEARYRYADAMLAARKVQP